MRSDSRQKIAGVLLALTVLTAGHGRAAQDPVEARLQQACLTLQQTPLSAPDLQTLAEVSRSATNSPALRSRAMAAYALALLLQGNTNAFARAVQIQKTVVPDQPPLISLTAEDYTAACADCLGKGEKSTPCPLCMGSGKCKACDGTGKKTAADGASSRCAACKGHGSCGMCGGQKNLIKACPTCKGAGRVIELKDTVRSAYTGLLTNMVALCQENVDFAEQFKKAGREGKADARIQLFQALTNRFSHRADLAPAQALLDEALGQREARLKELAEREAQERAQREVEALRQLDQATNIGGAIATLRAYLAAHPTSPAQLELQLLLDNLVDRQARQQLTRKIFIGCGVLLGVLLLILCLQPLLFRKSAAATGPLPGMDKINKADFTDPLSLTSQDSRNRDKPKKSS